MYFKTATFLWTFSLIRLQKVDRWLGETNVVLEGVDDLRRRVPRMLSLIKVRTTKVPNKHVETAVAYMGM